MKEDIIRMAREAGLWEADISKPLFDFAARVLANNPPQSSMAWQEGYEAGAAAEREAVCRIVTGLCISDNNAEEINRAIRERGKA